MFLLLLVIIPYYQGLLLVIVGVIVRSHTKHITPCHDSLANW